MSGVPIIGLTGGVASGKSTVADTLEELGCFVSDSDVIAHEVLLEPEVVRTLVDRWGQDILSEDGSPSRPRIGEMVFSDPKQRRWLEELLHPRINTRRRSAINAILASTEVPACVIDAPLLFEAGIDEECSTVIFVEAPIDRRREWALRNRGWNEAEFDRRERAQLDVEEKKRRSDLTITNLGSLEDLRTRTCEAFHSIIG